MSSILLKRRLTVSENVSSSDLGASTVVSALGDEFLSTECAVAGAAVRTVIANDVKNKALNLFMSLHGPEYRVAVINGDSPAFGFPPETYLIAPSLRVYELFMWYDENERWARN